MSMGHPADHEPWRRSRVRRGFDIHHGDTPDSPVDAASVADHDVA